MRKVEFVLVVTIFFSALVYADVSLTGEYWFGSLSADEDTWDPWGKLGTVIIDGNNWEQEWDDYDGHHSFSDNFTTDTQLDNSLNIEFSESTYNVGWNGNILIHANNSPDTNNRLGLEIVARRKQNIEVNDVVGAYSFFGHWLGGSERYGAVGWGNLDIYADGNAVATWVEQDGNERNTTVTWTLDDVNGILHISGQPDGFVYKDGAIMSFRATPDADGDYGYNFFIRKTNETLRPNDVAGTYVIRFLETSVFGEPFTCGQGTCIVRPDRTFSVDAWYSDGEHDVFETSYTIGPGNKLNIIGDSHVDEGIISPGLGLIFIPEYKVPPEPSEYDWIGGIFLIRTACNITDLNENMLVDLTDYAAFAAQWLNEGADLTGDFDSSSQVNWLDLKIFVDNWLWQVSWY